MRQLHRIALASLLTAGALTASAETAILVEAPDGTVTSVPVTTATKVTFPADGLTVTNAEARVFPYVGIAKVRFQSESGIPGIEAARCTLALRQNPVGDVLSVAGDIDAPARVTITSLSGQVALTIPEWNGADIDVSSLHPGFYLFSVNNQTLKFIKK